MSLQHTIEHIGRSPAAAEADAGVIVNFKWIIHSLLLDSDAAAVVSLIKPGVHQDGGEVSCFASGVHF